MKRKQSGITVVLLTSVLLTSLLLAGCGMKGALYMPPANKGTTTTAQPDNGNIQKNQPTSAGK